MAKRSIEPDLSRVVSGRLTVLIKGRGQRYANLGVPRSLAAYAAQAHFLITGRKIDFKDPASAPWQLVEFDEGKRILIVRETKGA